MKINPSLLEHGAVALRFSRDGLVVVTTIALFCLSLGLVFFGFIGYFSRVNLNSDFMKDAKENIDYVFMILDQLKADEGDLADLRQQKISAEYFYSSADTDARIKIYSSTEFKAYAAALGNVISEVQNRRNLLDEAYWKEITPNYDPEAVDMEWLARLANPKFKLDAPTDLTEAFTNQVRSRTDDLREKFIKLVVIRGTYLEGNVKNLQTNVSILDNAIRYILKRNPQLSTSDEALRYGLKMPSAEDLQALARQRAIVRSYDAAFSGLGSTVLRWPTIVSTLVVTLATGLLGALVSFLGALVRARVHDKTHFEQIGELSILALSRRAILGVAAALGIFLFAGSGLLVLTAQGGKAAAAGSLELSPYFVAFLAFISGFLADDAFSRLTAAGRAIFQTNGPGAPLPPAAPRPVPPSPPNPPAATVAQSQAAAPPLEAT